MTEEKGKATDASELRNQAERLMEIRSHEGTLPHTDISGLFRELRLHQAELEIQNDELKLAQIQLSQMNRDYVDRYYDGAPCGYLSLNLDGTIRQVNLTGVTLLGGGKRYLVSTPFRRLLDPESESVWQQAFKHSIQTGGDRNIELKLVRPDGETLWCRADIRADFAATGEVVQLRATLIDITPRKLVEDSLVEANTTLEKKVKERTNDLKLLNEYLICTEERERANIASDLHDGIGQTLALCISQIKTMEEEEAGVNEDLLAGIKTHLENAIREIKCLVYNLRPPILKDFEIDIALGFLIEERNKTHAMTVRYANNLDEEVILAETTKVTVYRAVNELLNNCVSHSGAREADVTLSLHGKRIHIRVEDTGDGFDVDAIKTVEYGHYGLYSLSERIRNMGGNVIIDSSPGKGTRITLVVPLD